MGYINIFVSKNANLFVKNNQLFLKGDDKQVDYPLEDINSIMLENLQTNISTYTLSKISEQNILTFICGQSHLPCGVILPFFNHYKTLSVYQKQIELSRPFQKQLWQMIIKNKIGNQNAVLNIFGGNNDLKNIQNQVLSGDSSNAEATASVKYFKQLFGDEFKRREETSINSFLNYGYAIIRGFVARSVAVHGLLPFLGIRHSNQFNQFNLADDLIEVFRPVVDLFVKTYLSDSAELNSAIKQTIYSIINYDVEIDGQKQTLSYAIDMFVESYVKSIQKNKNYLKDVKVINLEIHKYE